MKNSASLIISSTLWIIWGLVHVFYGVFVISVDAATVVQEIANAITVPQFQYPDALDALLNQHGWNLIWAGVITTIGGYFIWKNSRTAIWVTAVIGGCFDLGYFMFMDLGGYVLFFPGTLMTIIALTAILLSISANFKNNPSS